MWNMLVGLKDYITRLFYFLKKKKTYFISNKFLRLHAWVNREKQPLCSPLPSYSGSLSRALGFWWFISHSQLSSMVISLGFHIFLSWNFGVLGICQKFGFEDAYLQTNLPYKCLHWLREFGWRERALMKWGETRHSWHEISGRFYIIHYLCFQRLEQSFMLNLAIPKTKQNQFFFLKKK